MTANEFTLTTWKNIRHKTGVYFWGMHFDVSDSFRHTGYAGDTLERIILVASLSWGDEQETEFQRCAKTGCWPKRPAPDRTGAVL